MAGSLLFLYLFANYLLLITGNLLLLPWIIQRVYPASIHQAVGFYVAVTLVLKLDPWYWSIYLQDSSEETDIENTLMDMVKGEEVVRCEMYWKSNMETYITICKIDSQWEFAVWLCKLNQRLWINLEEWDGEGDGGEVLLEENIVSSLFNIHFRKKSSLVCLLRQGKQKQK